VFSQKTHYKKFKDDIPKHIPAEFRYLHPQDLMQQQCKEPESYIGKDNIEKAQTRLAFDYLLYCGKYEFIDKSEIDERTEDQIAFVRFVQKQHCCNKQQHRDILLVQGADEIEKEHPEQRRQKKVDSAQTLIEEIERKKH
jgi:hypothetical protein